MHLIHLQSSHGLACAPSRTAPASPGRCPRDGNAIVICLKGHGHHISITQGTWLTPTTPALRKLKQDVDSTHCSSRSQQPCQVAHNSSSRESVLTLTPLKGWRDTKNTAVLSQDPGAIASVTSKAAYSCLQQQSLEI